MAIMLSALGAFIYVQFRSDLRAALDEGLRARLADAARRDVSGALAQAYGPAGKLTRGSGQRLVTPAEARRAQHRTLTVARRHLATGDVRVRAGPRRGGGAAAVAEPLRRPDEELENLTALLLVAGPLALGLASFAGYEVAGAALRPVNALL